MFGSAQNSTSVVSPISLPSKVHGYSTTIEKKEALHAGAMLGQRLKPYFLSGTPWEDTRGAYICFIPNTVFLPFGIDLILGNISNEDIRDQIESKWGQVEIQWVTAVYNLMHNEGNGKDILEAEESTGEESDKILPEKYNNPIKPSETPCIAVTTLSEDPMTNTTIQQIYRRVGFQPQAVPQAPAQVPQAPAQNPVP